MTSGTDKLGQPTTTRNKLDVLIAESKNNPLTGQPLSSGGGGGSSSPTPTTTIQDTGKTQAEKDKEYQKIEQDIQKKQAELTTNYRANLRNYKTAGERFEAVNKLSQGLEQARQQGVLQKVEGGLIKSGKYQGIEVKSPEQANILSEAINSGKISQSDFNRLSPQQQVLFKQETQAQEVKTTQAQPNTLERAKTFGERLSSSIIPNQQEPVWKKVLYSPTRGISFIGGELSRGVDIVMQKNKDYKGAESFMKAAELAPSVAASVIPYVAPVYFISSGSQKAIEGETFGEKALGVGEVGLGILSAGVGKKIIGEISSRGRTEIPKEKLITTEVLSGKETFPQSPPKTHYQQFINNRFNLPNKQVPTGYHATAKPWKELKTQPGSSEFKGTFVSPSLSPHFLRVGSSTSTIKPDIVDRMFGDIIYGSEPGIMNIQPTRFVKGYKGKEGEAFVPGAAGYSKTETQAIITPNTRLELTGKNYFVKYQGKNINIDEFKTLPGETSGGVAFKKASESYNLGVSSSMGRTISKSIPSSYLPSKISKVMSSSIIPSSKVSLSSISYSPKSISSKFGSSKIISPSSTINVPPSIKIISTLKTPNYKSPFIPSPKYPKTPYLNIPVPKTPYNPPPIYPKFTDGLSKVKSLIAKLRTPGYRVQIKRKGKYQTIAQNLPLGRAKQLLTKKVTSTLAQTGRLLESGSSNVPDISFEVPSNIFTRLKKPTTSLEWVERRGQTLKRGYGEVPEIMSLKRKKRSWLI